MTTYNKYDTNCPDFSVGNCSSYKNGICKYKYHKKCNNSFLCNREDCKFGHTISYSKRLIINNIYNKKYSRMSSPYNDNRCSNPINCINKDCNFDHHLAYDDRKFIYNIINPSITEDNAWSNYENKYNSHSPASSKLSYSSTVPAICSPIPNSFISLCKKEEDYREDDMISIITDMKNIRSNIDIDTKKADDIKEQIKKLKEELNNTKEKINKDKNKLKELAIKIAKY